MDLEFTKMNGAGNDFVLIDNRTRAVELTDDQVRRLCDRQRGVGADGVFLVEPATVPDADWAWRFYNSDGSTADMCGNGARCFARFVRGLDGDRDRVTFQTGAGLIRAVFDGDRVSVDLTTPRDLVRGCRVDTGSEGGVLTVDRLNTGVPHAVVFVEDLDGTDVVRLGRLLRRHAEFAPDGTNVNFVRIDGPGSISVRTYERGVEGETLACGTGVTASALLASLREGWSSPVAVRVRSGETLSVSFERDQYPGVGFREVRLAGPAEVVFTGRIRL